MKKLYTALILSSTAWVLSAHADDNSMPTATADGVENVGYYEVIGNKSICSHKTSGIPPLWQLLKKHQIGFTAQNNPHFPSDSDWLTTPDDCVIATNPSFLDEGYIYTFYDKNSPLYVFILVDKTQKQYLIAKVERTDWQQPIAQGKISYVGTSALPQAKSTLANHIADR